MPATGVRTHRVVHSTGPRNKVHFEILPGEPSEYVEAARRCHLVDDPAAGIVLGAGSMAAAASSALDWVPWAGNADRAETFTSPRGQSCDALFRLVLSALCNSGART